MHALNKFLIVRFISSLGDQLLLFTIPLLVYKATHNIAMSGLAFFIEWLPRILSLPFAGVLSDKFGGRKVYLTADAVRMMINIVGFFWIIQFPQSTFYVASILASCCAIFYAQAFIAQEATIPTLVPVDVLHKAQSKVQTIEQAAMILGPLLGSLLSYLLPIPYLLLVIATVFGSSFIGMLLLKSFTQSHTHSGEKNILRELSTGFMILIRNQQLLWMCSLTIAVNLIWGMMLATSAAFITGIYAKSTATFGYFQTLSGALSILALLATPFLINKTSLKFMSIFSFGLIVLGAFLVGLHLNFTLFILGYFSILAMDSVFNIYIRTERAKIIPREHMGKTIGLIVLVNQLSIPLSGLLIARFSGTLGPEKLFIIVGIIAGIFWVVQTLHIVFQLYLSPKTSIAC